MQGRYLFMLVNRCNISLEVNSNEAPQGDKLIRVGNYFISELALFFDSYFFLILMILNSLIFGFSFMHNFLYIFFTPFSAY